LTKEDKESKVHTFIALLHLANGDQRKIDMAQPEPFGDIEIMLNASPPIPSGKSSNL
jgi:chromatin segregation and condensation protein Rec8/ScpA/Scc1 (kleisin family)